MSNVKKVKIRPSKKDSKVYNPKTSRFINENGEEVELSVYWKRRLNNKEVTKIEENLNQDSNKKKINKNKNIETIKSEE